MSAEMMKPAPNMSVIDDRMSRTLAAQRQAVISKPLPELLEEYPALTLDNQVYTELLHSDVKLMQLDELVNAVQPMCLNNIGITAAWLLVILTCDGLLNWL